LDILTGPEWMLMPIGKIYSKEQKEEVIKEIIQKTKTTNSLVLPGTIMWHENRLVYNTTPIINGRM